MLVERRSPSPLIRLGVLRSGSQVRAQLGAVAFFGSYVGFQFLTTLYMQSLLGWSALHTALAFLPAGALVAVSSTKVGAIVDRFGTPRLIATGFALMVLGYALFLRVDLDPVYAAVILPSMLLIGAAARWSSPRSTSRPPTASRTTSRAWSPAAQHLGAGRRGGLPRGRHRRGHRGAPRTPPRRRS